MEMIELFPLRSVLFPKGKMALQVFEPRYLDLISRSLKHNTGFGIVWLRQGSEVHKPEPEESPWLAQVGTFAKVVGWDALPNGLLGVTIEGEKKFRLISSHQRQDRLHVADVEWIDDEPVIDLPEENQEIKTLLLQLLDHPHIKRLELNPVVTDVETLANLLAQFLPIEEPLKFDLLALSEPIERMQKLMEVLDQFSE